MKSKMKHSLILLMLLVASFTLFNCQSERDDLITNEGKIEKEFPFTSSLLTTENIIFNKKLSNQIVNITGIQSYGLSKSVYNSVYDFTIHTEVVNFVESIESNVHSYTFLIERENSIQNSLENLVFSYDESIDDYTANIVTYHFTDSQRQEFLLNQHVSTAYDISYETVTVNTSDLLNKNTSLPCTSTYTVYHITPDTGETFVHSTNNQHNECKHEDEDGNIDCETYTIIEVDCPHGGDSNGLGTDDNTNTTGGPNTGGTGGNNNDRNDLAIVTAPTIIKKQLSDIDGFTSDMNDWLNQNIDVKLALITLLNETQDADILILEIINELMADEELTLEEYIMMQYVFKAPINPINDIEDYLNCFDITQGAELTIYADQPIVGSRETWTWGGDVGHAYIGITQGDTTRILGLYPTENTTPLDPNATMVYGNDQGYNSDASITKQISGSDLANLINEITTNDNDYNLNTNNCSTFAIRIANLGGINLPSTESEWPGGSGNNPADLGEDIREMTQLGTVVNPETENSPQNNGDC